MFTLYFILYTFSHLKNNVAYKIFGVRVTSSLPVIVLIPLKNILIVFYLLLGINV